MKLNEFLIKGHNTVLQLPKEYADGSENRLSPAKIAGMEEPKKPAVIPVELKVGIPNEEGCDHENEELVYSDQWTHYYVCRDCGTETQEDR